MQDTHWQIPPNPAKSLMLAKRQLSEFVCDAVNLEGINITLPEVQTLLDGITVGGHKLSDQQITVNQGNAWRLLFGLIERGEFTVSAEIACQLHAAAGKEEALEWEDFGFDAMITDLAQINDIYNQAIHIFLTMARCQFFYDVNKRMGRFMMNGHLLQHGYPAINLPAKRQLEFNTLMLAFYSSGDETAMNAFMRSCMDERVLRIMREA